MAWEKRQRGQYYYRSQRIDGQIKKVYLGCGDVAKQADADDAAARAKWASNAAEVMSFQAKLSAADQLAAEVRHGADLLTEATLISLGYHQHHGQWRRSRNVD